jgi:hypothetical protein
MTIDPVFRLLLWLWAGVCLLYVVLTAFLTPYRLSDGGMVFQAFVWGAPLAGFLWVTRRRG